MNRLAVYPGSFDPITLGHLDIIRRARRLFDGLVVAVSRDSGKNPAFAVDQRAALVRAALREAGLERQVRVETFGGLLADFLIRRKAQAVVRGLRFISDFEYEFQMTLMNRRLLPGLETVFLMPDERYSFLSSSIVKEISRLGRVPKGMVPRCVAEALRRLAH